MLSRTNTVCGLVNVNTYTIVRLSRTFWNQTRFNNFNNKRKTNEHIKSEREYYRQIQSTIHWDKRDNHTRFIDYRHVRKWQNIVHRCRRHLLLLR